MESRFLPRSSRLAAALASLLACNQPNTFDPPEAAAGASGADALDAPGPGPTGAGDLPDGSGPLRSDAAADAAASDAGGPSPATDPCAGVQCVFPNATSACNPTTGRCSPPVCRPGYGDCDGLPGCEDPLDTPARCGGCSSRCGTGFVCGPARACGCAHAVCEDGGGPVCIDLATSGDHCGRCGHPCPAGCAAGSCRCVGRSGANLVDGGFDREVSPLWTGAAPDTDWQADDAAGCPGSGSMIVRNTNADPRICHSNRYCVPVSAGVLYNFGAWVKPTFPGVRDNVSYVSIGWFSAPDCASAVVSSDGAMPGARLGIWRPHVGQARAPSGARSAELDAGFCGPGEMFVDVAHITPAPGRF